MDTRRDPDARENAPSRPSEEQQPTVEVVELDGVQARRRGSAGGAPLTALVGAALAVGVAAVALRPQADAGAEGSAPPGTQAAEATATAAATSAPTSAPTDSVEPEPTVAFDGFRAVHIEGYDSQVSIRHLWPLYNWETGDRFLALAERDLSGPDVESIFLTSETGDEWSVVEGPIDGFVFRAGVVEGNQMLSIGWVPTSTGVQWHQYTITSELNWLPWEPSPVMVGFDDVDELVHLTRNNAGWLAVVELEGRRGQELRYSDDGVTWAPVPDFELDSDASVVAVVPNFPRFVLVTNEPAGDGRTRIAAWTSEDRLHWNEQRIETLVGEATGLTAADSAFPSHIGPFALAGWEVVDGTTRPRAWTSPDGLTWSVSEISRSPDTSGLIAVAAGQMGILDHPGGYARNHIAVANDGAWTSLDAVQWSPVPFLPAGATDEIRSVAVLGKLVVAGGRSADGLTIWVREAFPEAVPDL